MIVGDDKKSKLFDDGIVKTKQKSIVIKQQQKPKTTNTLTLTPIKSQYTLPTIKINPTEITFINNNKLIINQQHQIKLTLTNNNK